MPSNPFEVMATLSTQVSLHHPPSSEKQQAKTMTATCWQNSSTPSWQSFLVVWKTSSQNPCSGRRVQRAKKRFSRFLVGTKRRTKELDDRHRSNLVAKETSKKRGGKESRSSSSKKNRAMKRSSHPCRRRNLWLCWHLRSYSWVLAWKKVVHVVWWKIESE